MEKIKIATRKSPLALYQAEYVREKLTDVHVDLEVELVCMQTAGDRFLDRPLSTVGGKGLFVKELEQALLCREADIAVHSMKDVTIDLPDGLRLPVIMKREDTRDVLVSNKYQSLEQLPDRGQLGTSSLRRQAQMRAWRPNLIVQNLRGNVGTRLKRLDEGDYDALLLAAAGMKRLGLSERITQYLSHAELLPAIGQGAIGIECRADAPEIYALIKPLDDVDTALCVRTERAFSRRLYGGCQLPIAGQASISSGEINLTGLVARTDGSEIIKGERKGAVADAEHIGMALAESLLERGADKILNELLH